MWGDGTIKQLGRCNYLQAETISRHILTNAELKKLQAVELELLIEFDRICRANNILYSIDGGTLLGAVRHSGFIPWDDDADVIMVRSEYDKFKSVCNQELDKTRFYFQDLDSTSGYRWGYGKLRRRNSSFIRLNQEHMPYEQGIFLDVFVCDNVPENYYLRSMCNLVSFLYRKTFWSVVGRKTEKGWKRVLFFCLSLFPEETLKRSYRWYVMHRNKKYSIWVKCLTFPACNRTYGYKREWYEDVEDITFENVILKGSRKATEYLKFLYGDYMALPPVEKQKVHPVSVIKFPD